jgi:hypothetical protein
VSRRAFRSILEASDSSKPVASVDLARQLWLAIGVTAVLLVLAWRYLAPPIAPLLFPGPTIVQFASTRGLFQPKPVGFVRYFLDVGAAALVVPVFLGIRLSRARLISSWGVDALVVLVQAGMVALLVACWNAQETAHSWFSGWQLATGCGIGLVVLTIAIATRRRRCSPVSPRSRRVRRSIGVGAATIFTSASLLPAVFTEGNIGHAFIGVRGQVGFVLDEMSSVAAGRHPLVDFAAQYTRLMPFAIWPVSSVTESSIGRFTVAMAILSLITLLAIYFVFSKVMESHLVALAFYLPFVAVTSLPQLVHGNELIYLPNVYDYLPFRLLGPFLIAAVCTSYLVRGRVRHVPLFTLAGIVAINNSEWGIPCFCALVVGLWCGRVTRRSGWLGIRDLLRDAALGATLAVLLVCGLTLVAAGSLPQLGVTTQISRLFLVDGLGAQPTSVLGLHVAIYLTFVAALAWGLLATLCDAMTRPLRGMLAYVGILGLGGFSSWAGRSHPLALSGMFPAWAVATALLVWAIVRSIRTARELSPLFVIQWLVPSVVVVTMFGLMISSFWQFPAPSTQIHRIVSHDVRPVEGVSADEASLCASSTPAGCLPLITRADRVSADRFVSSRSRPGDRVVILTELGHVVARESRVVNVSPYPYPDLILSASQLQGVLRELRASGGSKVFLGATWPEIPTYLTNHGFRMVKLDPQSRLVEYDRLATRRAPSND